MISKVEEKYYTYKLNMGVLNFLAILLFIFVGGFVFLFEYHDSYVIHYSMITLFLKMVLWLMIHEILHGIGFSLFKEVDRRNITFGAALEKGVLYCMCKQNIHKKVILVSLFFPVSIIGVLTLIIGMWLNHFELVFLSILNIVSSIGDIVMIIYFFKAPKDIIYLDLDDCTSFTVVSKEKLEGIRVWGIELVSHGIYDAKKMVSKDRRRFIISKASYLLFLVIFVLMIIKVVGGML